jgi:hypothetical protein
VAGALAVHQFPQDDLYRSRDGNREQCAEDAEQRSSQSLVGFRFNGGRRGQQLTR